jgi:very-short-patch-repair endonuclease
LKSGRRINHLTRKASEQPVDNGGPGICRRHHHCMDTVADWQEWWAEIAATAPPGLVLSSAELRATGTTRQRVRTLVRRGTWTLCGYGYVAPFDVRDARPHVTGRRLHALASAAAVRRRPDHAMSGRSAAVVHGLPTLRCPQHVELTEAKSRDAGRRQPVHVRAAGLRPNEITSWFGLPILTPSRTLVDLGRHDRRDAIMAADAALAADLVRVDEVDAALALARGWPGVRQARAVLALASRRAESPLESLTRLALHDDGFPAPLLQVQIPGTPYRVDMLWPDSRLILEIDGVAKYTDLELRREKIRELRLRALGYRVERVGWADVVLHWARTRVWLGAALRLPGQAG